MTFNKILRPAVAEIDLSALAFNVQQIQKKVGPHCNIVAIVKANAYGHGDTVIARHLQSIGLSSLGVAYIEEGIRLREADIKTDILVLSGGQHPQTFQELHRYHLTPVFYDLDYLIAYNDFCRKKNKKGKVHLKFDTGLNRLGFSKKITPAVFKKLPNLRNLIYEGMMTKLANEFRPSHFNQEQIQIFRRLQKESSVAFKYYHLASSGAILHDFGINENMVRPGLALYGSYPSVALKEKVVLKPVMKIKSQIIQLKAVKKGDYISYAYTHRFKTDSLVATIPLGYADGYAHSFSNKGEVLIRGKRASIVGMVCMDVFMVEVNHIPGVTVGDEVILLGEQKRDVISVEALAQRIHSDPREIFCSLSNRIPRVIGVE